MFSKVLNAILWIAYIAIFIYFIATVVLPNIKQASANPGYIPHFPYCNYNHSRCRAEVVRVAGYDRVCNLSNYNGCEEWYTDDEKQEAADCLLIKAGRCGERQDDDATSTPPIIPVPTSTIPILNVQT